jgi:hypothetical protein
MGQYGPDCLRRKRTAVGKLLAFGNGGWVTTFVSPRAMDCLFRATINHLVDQAATIRVE